MVKKNYYCKLCGLYDTVRGKLVNIAVDETLGSYARAVIPQYKEIYPLNDLMIAELGEINPYTGEIHNNKMILNDWKECYNFEISGKAVKDESETIKETSKEW